LLIAAWAVSIALALWIALALSLRLLRGWLVTNDPLRRAACIFVHGGHVPYRAMEAAELFHQGWAPEIWLTQFPPNPEEQELAKLGLEIVPEHFYNQSVLEKLHVPREAIVILDPSIDTRTELTKVRERLRRSAPEAAVILVTSRFHGRRVKAIWKSLRATNRACVRVTSHGGRKPGSWRNTGDLREIAYEFFGLLNVWAGYPARRRY
jgi:uncharacterized SAM-binding protein YcdF (DUF218 family)